MCLNNKYFTLYLQLTWALGFKILNSCSKLLLEESKEDGAQTKNESDNGVYMSCISMDSWSFV